MIDKPKNWEEFDENETGTAGVPKGIYIVKVVAVKDIDVKQYLEVKFDIVKGEHEGIFKKLCNGDYSVWPNQGIYRASYKESATKFFKRFITAVQKSNQNYVWDWNEQSLLGKYFVAVMGEEEYEKDGDIKVGVKCREVRSLEALKEGAIKVPEIKKLKEASTVASAPSIDLGELPF